MLKQSEMSANKVYENFCRDDVIIMKVKLVWKITDFYYRREKVTSPLFPISGPDSVGKWSLELDPKNGVAITINEKTSKVSAAQVILSLLNDKGNVAIRQDEECRGGSCFIKLASRDYVFNRVALFDYGCITIVCEVEVQVTSKNRSPAKCEPPPSGLAEDWANLQASGALTDVTIAVGGAELRAHKVVLAARSPVFAAMFSNQMLENETNVVNIADMDADTFQAMLEFIYTDKEISQTGGAHNLLAAANKYQLERLKFMCEEALCMALSLDNVLENLALADLHNAPRLKEQSISLIIAHRAKILESPSWNTFKQSHQSLLVEIFEKICLQE